MYPPSLLWGTFHLSKLTGQKIPVKMIILLLIKTIQSNPKWRARRKWCFKKNSWKNAFFIVKMTGQANGPAGQFWLSESAQRRPHWKLLCTVNSTKLTKQHVTNTSDATFITIATIFLFLLFYTKQNIPSEEVWKILVEIRSCKNWIFCYPDFVQIVCHAYCHQPRTTFCWHFGEFFCIVGWRRLKYKQIFRWDKLVEPFSLTDTSLNIKWGTVHKNLPFFLYSDNSFINVIVFTMVVKFEIHIQLQRLCNHPLIHHLHIDHNAPW